MRLRTTALLAAALVVVPAALLLLFPRRLATGLDRLLPDAALLQSFAVRPAQPLPDLWRERLGDGAGQRLWQRQRGLWWQFWGPHGDAGAYLVLVAPPSEPLPAHSLRVDDLLVVAPSPLARQLLEQQLRLQRRLPKGLSERCSRQLLQRQAVAWNPAALGQMLGPLAPLALSLQQGCLLLSADVAALLWQGEADASPGAVAPPPLPLPLPPSQPLAAPQLLELRGRRLELVLRGLLSSAVLRDSLASRYGLGREQMRRLQAAAFVLELQARPSGPYRAGLVLQLQLPGERAFWERSLVDLSRALESQGLAASRPLAGLTLWSREDRSTVGGWRWLAANRLQLFLGPTPALAQPAGPTPSLQAAMRSDWQLRLRPDGLAAAGLLPEALPTVVDRARQVLLIGSGQRQSALAGRLELR